MDVSEPQRAIDDVRRATPVVRWELGVGFFRMEDLVAAGRNPAIVSTNPATGVPFGMGSEKPLIPLHFDGDLHRAGRVELHDAFCVPLPSTIFLALFGMPLEDMRALMAFKDRILKNEGTTMEEREGPRGRRRQGARHVPRDEAGGAQGVGGAERRLARPVHAFRGRRPHAE